MVIEHFDGAQLAADGDSWIIRLLFAQYIAIDVRMYGLTPYLLSVRALLLFKTAPAPEDGAFVYTTTATQNGNPIVGDIEDKVTTTSYICIGETTDVFFEANKCDGGCTPYDFTIISNTATNNVNTPFNPSLPAICDGYSVCVHEYWILLYTNPWQNVDEDDRADRMQALVTVYRQHRAQVTQWDSFDWQNSCNCPERIRGGDPVVPDPFPGSASNFTCQPGFYSIVGFEVSECTLDGWSPWTVRPVCIFCSKLCGFFGACVADSAGVESCDCDADWTGEFCTISTTCSLDCNGNGDCVIDVNAVPPQNCDCNDGWAGEFCEIECSLNCVWGNCVTPDDPPNSADVCICEPIWWTGPLCDLFECNPLCEQGTCVIDGGVGTNGGATGLGPVCDCDVSWTGQTCDTPVCNPGCGNNGICSYNPSATVPIYCSCNFGWEGDTCDDPICTPRCVEGQGICEITGTNLDMLRCRCYDGWGGDDCGTPIACNNNGPCESGACYVRDTGDVYCVCYNGYTGLYCDSLITDDCTACTAPGMTGECSPPDYECVCQCGYTGPACNMAPQYCTFNPCLNNGVCNIVNNLPECCCQPGFSGGNCEIGMCDNTYCNGKGECALDGNGDRFCTCFDGYSGTLCQTAVCPLDCNQNGVCTVSATGGYICACWTGFTGERCEESIPNCQQMCLNGGTCNGQTNRCDCFDGYFGDYCEIEINNCGSINCENGGLCEIEHVLCRCTEGWTGPYCQTPDPGSCGTITCMNGGWCQYLGYSCFCPPGYTGSTCETSISTCGPLTCLNGGVCWQNENGYQCNCPAGYYGMYCENAVTSCLQVDCKNGGACTYLENTFKCLCQPGWYGPLCESFNSNCQNNPCKNGGSCFNVGQNPICYCPKGYTGTICERDINECAVNQSPPCANGRCQNLYGTFKCMCDTGYTGRFCTVPLEICETNPCLNNGVCRPYYNNYDDGFGTGTGIGGKPNEDFDIADTQNWYTCTCPVNWTGRNCEVDVNECKVPYQTPCLNGAGCMNVPGDYKCNCTYKFYGKDCEYQFSQCTPSVCTNGGRCEEIEYGYKCWCLPGYSGANCQIIIDGCRDIECRNDGICVNNEGNAKCVCGKGYGGSRCEELVDDTQRIVMISLLVVLGVFILFGVAVLICCCWRNTCQPDSEEHCKEEEVEVTTCAEPWTFSSPMITHHVNSYGTYCYRPGNEIYLQKQQC